jgi:hypothetical protein
MVRLADNLPDDPDYVDPDHAMSLGVMVPVDKNDHEGMLRAVYEMMIRGVSQPMQLARYLRTSTAKAAALKLQVDEVMREGIAETDPEVHRARLVASAAHIQTEAMRLHSTTVSESMKVSTLKVAVSAVKMQSDLLRLTGQRNNTSIVVDNSDNRVAIRNDLGTLDVPPEVLDQLAAQMTAAASTQIKQAASRR